MTKGKQWQAGDLPVDSVRTHKDLQFRAQGLSPQNLSRITRALEAGGEAKDPIRVARIGKALYVVDGFHRLEAYRKVGRSTVPALVAKMNLQEARSSARAFNAMNGRSYSRADKELVWGTYLAEGNHMDALGNVKSCREIAQELGQVYSYETVRKKLKAAGVELDEAREYPDGYTPMSRDDGLDEDRALEAASCLRTFGELVTTLADYDKQSLLKEARRIVEAAEGGEEPDLRALYDFHGLDI